MRVKSNKLQHLREFYHEVLAPVFPAGEIDALFYTAASHYLGMSRTQLLTSGSLQLNQSDLLRLYDCAKELARHVPLQYILGEAWFYGLRFSVGPAVLIPRPETEELVDLIIKDHPAPLSILDIGTGSGCIPVALARNMPQTAVSACDVSAEALDVARSNATAFHLNISFFECDILSADPLGGKRFDLIVSNPPYILASEKSTLAPHVSDHEPQLALFAGGSDPIIFYRSIIALCRSHLKEKGRLYFELNPLTASMVDDDAKKSGLFSETAIIKDLSGNNRFFKAIRK